MRFILALGTLLATSGLANAADPTFPSSAGNLSVQTVATGQEGEITWKIIEDVLHDTPRSVTSESPIAVRKSTSAPSRAQPTAWLEPLPP